MARNDSMPSGLNREPHIVFAVQTVLDLARRGRTEPAAKFARFLIARAAGGLRRATVETVVGAVCKPVPGKRLSRAQCQLLAAAADAGLALAAYNLGTHLHEDAEGSTDAARLSEDYLERCRALCDIPGDLGLWSASLVNQGTLVRDGLCNGRADWHRALQMFAQAGEVGNVYGMLYAGNLAARMTNQSLLADASLAAYWYEELLAVLDTGRAPNPPAPAQDLERMRRKVSLALAQIHIRGDFPAASAARGLALLRSYGGSLEGHEELALEGLRKLLDALPACREATAARAWRAVLAVLGWQTRDATPASDTEFTVFSLRHREMRVLVSEEPLYPGGVADHVTARAARLSRINAGRPVIVLGAGAPILARRTRAVRAYYLPVFLANADGTLDTVALHAGCDNPDRLIEQQTGGAVFGRGSGHALRDTCLASAVNIRVPPCRTAARTGSAPDYPPDGEWTWPETDPTAGRTSVLQPQSPVS